MVGVVGDDWLQRNDGRDYPLVDGADVTIPTNLIVDMHVAFLSSSPASKVYFSRMEVTKPRVVLEVSDDVDGVLLTLDIELPQPYRNYLFTQAGSRIAHGFVCFGSAIDTGSTSFKNLALAPSQSTILASRVVRLEESPFTSVVVGGRSLVGDVPLVGEGGLNVVYKNDRIQFELDNTIQALEEPLRDCQIPLESGKIPESESWPFLKVNDLYPTVGGAIDLQIDLAECEKATFSVSGNVLSVMSQEDYTESCVQSVRRLLVDYGSGCESCVYTVEMSGDIRYYTPHRVFIHRKWLVIEWAYGGESEASYASGVPILSSGLAATYVSSTVAKPIELVYDRTGDDCEPSAIPTPPEAGRIVYQLSAGGDSVVIRNKEFTISLELPEGTMSDNDDEEAPGFSMGCIPIRDPFLFNADYMDASEEAVIANEVAAYRAGDPPWEDEGASG